MAQCHKICLFLEHRVTFAMIYVKFNNHKRIISYSLWKGHGAMKISPWKKKTFANIFAVERCTHFKFPTIKENTKTYVWSKNHGSGFLCTQVILGDSTVHVSNVLSLHCKKKKKVGLP